MKRQKILVGLSGGVDSAVAAYLLQQQGYEVVGGFMKNYTSDTGTCTTYKDAEEAIKVAKFLGIELLSFDLQKEYQEKIIDYIFSEYSQGITPNPDVLCNSLIKFDVFLNQALALGFNKIATGHYARISKCHGLSPGQGGYKTGGCRTLKKGKDKWKDQSYFLAGLNQFQLSKSLFPLGELTKDEVRKIAKETGLPNAERPDSQGLCFIGNVPIRQFLMQRFPEKEGDIVYVSDLNNDFTPGQEGRLKGGGVIVGKHKGAYFYTIGQKQGLGLNFKAYVYRIDIPNNILYVTDKDSDQLKTKSLIAKNRHWITPSLNPLSSPLLGGGGATATTEEGAFNISGKIRYRQIPAVPCNLTLLQNGDMQVNFQNEQRAVAPGQVFVAYNGETCLGSGIIA